ncbi:MAG: response regulator [Anaerolineae bacterium]|jgi:adenylate cyclase|nr:response regulator [Anaerolineae bacterium]
MAAQKVLIAEDNYDSRELVSDILLGLGYVPVMAENGKVALDKILDDPPDLVILDVNMPVMDGFEVCEALKRNPSTAKIPVIMLTAQTDVESRVTGLGLGAEDYLPKPFHPRELIARINARLRAKELADSLREQREQIRQTFERFVAHEIVEQLLEDPTRVQLGGAEAIITVLFADLEGFTTMAERTEPCLLLDVLNSYHALLVEHIKSNGGTVDKFLGDGVMALYNTPLPQPDHALRAVRTALEIRDALVNFHQQFDAPFQLDVNVGIHTGWAVIGNIGTPELMNFTAIGDTVNIASRLQEMSTKSQIIISEDTYHLVTGDIVAEQAGSRIVRGREKPVEAYLAVRLR